MGPHVFACGNIDMSDDTGGVELVASMGPHVFACGNRATQRALYAERALQWGRTFLRAEILGASAGRISAVLLQWGRTFLRAEIRSTARSATSMRSLQWGRTFLRAEMFRKVSTP